MRRKWYVQLAVVLLWLAAVLILDRWLRGSWKLASIVSACEAIVLVVLFIKYPRLMVIIGEGRGASRSGSHLLMILIMLALFLPSFSFYTLASYSSSVSSLGPQLSILAISPILGGLVLAAVPMSSSGMELTRVAHKLIFATILFVLFVPAIFLVNQLGSIDVSTMGNLRHTEDWTRGLYFWVAVPSFYGGIALFSVALVDLAFTLSHTRPIHRSQTHLARAPRLRRPRRIRRVKRH